MAINIKTKGMLGFCAVLFLLTSIVPLQAGFVEAFSSFKKFASNHKKTIIGSGMALALLSCVAVRLAFSDVGLPMDYQKPRYFGPNYFGPKRLNDLPKDLWKYDSAVAKVKPDLHYIIVGTKEAVADIKQPLVINFLSDTVSYHRLDDAAKIVELTGCPVVSIDYPGICGSKGWPWNAQNCANKIIKQIEFIQREHSEFKDRKLLVLGSFFGSYVGALIAAKKQCPLFAARNRRLSGASDIRELWGRIIPRFILDAIERMRGIGADQTKLLKSLAKENLVVVLDKEDWSVDYGAYETNEGEHFSVKRDTKKVGGQMQSCTGNLIHLITKDKCSRYYGLFDYAVTMLSPVMLLNQWGPASPLVAKFKKLLADKQMDSLFDAIVAFIETCKGSQG